MLVSDAPPTDRAASVRWFRSLLYAPGDREDRIVAAAASDADALIFDLEDRVPADRKDVARRIVRDALASLGSARPLYVRVNPLDSGLMRADLDAVAGPTLTAVRIPKVGTVEGVRAVDAVLASVEAAHGLVAGAIQLCLGLETAAAVRSTFALCEASDRVTSVAVGSGRGGDLQTDVGYVPTEAGDETLMLRSRVVLEARAAGVPIPLDGGFGTYRSFDPEAEGVAFRRSAEMGRQLGYRAKICFHPDQAALINEVFGPLGAVRA